LRHAKSNLPRIINQIKFIMKQKLILLLCFAVPLFCMAQRQLVRQYEYDAAGNRTLRKTVDLIPKGSEMLATIPPDSTETEELQVTSNELRELGLEYFVEKIAQTEIKIYPNPATEKITLEFSGDVRDENFRPLQLYSLNGQLLQEQPVHSAATTISLAGFAKGAYILKVHVNGVTEEWKIIKQ